MLSKASLLAAGLLAFFISGCMHVPTQELSQYRNAFAQVQTASEEILIDFAEIKEKSESFIKATAATQPSTPSYFSTSLESGSGRQPDAVEVRRTALRTIDKFNNVLTTLAEGKSIETVQCASIGFTETMGKFIAAASGSAVPGLSQIAELARTLIGEFEKARIRSEFEKALRAGAPVIDRILSALIEERANHIELRSIEANSIQVGIIDDITSSASSVFALFQQFSAPAHDDPVERIQKALNESMKPAERLYAFKLPIELTYSAGKPSLPAFGKEQEIIAEQAVIKVRERIAAYKANIEQFERLKSALNNYGAMLQKTRASLNMLADALDRPQKFETASEAFFEFAFNVKREIEAFRAARKGAQ
jgi:hypothetical protein